MTQVAAKTYKRETAWVFGVFVLSMFVWGVLAQRPDIVDVARYLTPFSATALTAALGADFVKKQT